MSLPKRIIVFLISLLSTLSFIPQINIASAATSTPNCSAMNPSVSISVQYQLSLEQWSDWTALNANTTIPEGIKDIHFQVSGGNSIPSKNINGQDILYRIYFPALNASTDNQQADGGVTGVLSAFYFGGPNPSPLITRGIRYGTLQSNASGSYTDYCQGIDYSVGAATVYDFSTCRMTISPSKPAANQTVVASVQQAPPTEPGSSYTIIYRPNEEYIDKTNSNRQSDRTVTIDQNGNGHFVFFTDGSPHTGVGLYLDDRAGHVFCRLDPETFNIDATSSTAPNNCSIDPADPTIATDIFVIATNLVSGKKYRADKTVLRAPNGQNENTNLQKREVADGHGVVRLPLNDPLQKLTEGHYSAQVYKDEDNSLACTKDFWVGQVGVPPVPVRPCSNPNSSTCGSSGGRTDPGCPGGIITAIGCIHTSPTGFIKDFLAFVIGISGSLAFLMMLLGAFQMLTSAGNPETLNAGRERLTSATIGLLFVIFAMLLLQIIGFGILNLPGFGT